MLKIPRQMYWNSTPSPSKSCGVRYLQLIARERLLVFYTKETQSKSRGQAKRATSQFFHGGKKDNTLYS